MMLTDGVEWQQVSSTLHNEKGKQDSVAMYRARVPGGWFVKIYYEGVAAFFYPDPEHKWDGKTVE